MDLSALLELAKITAIAAGSAIMPFYSPAGGIAFNKKADSSPVTAADLAANTVIGDKLSITPYPLLSEESNIPAYAIRRTWPIYWLSDPLDGTREFMVGSTDFTVNIALIADGNPVLGVIYAPATGLLYFSAEGIGAFKQTSLDAHPQTLSTHRWQPGLTHIAISRRHGVGKRMQKLLAQFEEVIGAYEVVSAGSSLKIGFVAEGAADVYPRLSPTSEWDTAAGQAILEAAGGHLLDFQGNPIRYNQKEDLENPMFLALGDSALPWKKLMIDWALP